MTERTGNEVTGMKVDNSQVRVSVQERLRTSAFPDWLVKMREHYAKTGTYRPGDLRRLLGDPTRRVEVGPKPTANSFLGTPWRIQVCGDVVKIVPGGWRTRLRYAG
jgi:hypothetical protein